MEGCVADIQRFSVHDGSGIRTTVFLKGCNMRCSWCHNPETINPLPQLTVINQNCIGCGLCVLACPHGAIQMMDGRERTNFQECQACFSCIDACFSEARVRTGIFYSPQKLLTEVLWDAPYYREDGGVTFSGGEPLYQAEFVRACAELFYKHNIRCAVETNLSLPWIKISSAIQMMDFVMLDIKAADPVLHKALTGVHLEPIIENILRLDKMDIPYIIRTPVIPNTNDGEIQSIARLLQQLMLKNLQYYELLSYNSLAEEKFRRLGKDYILSGLKPLKNEKMFDLVDAASKFGIPVKHNN